MNAWEMIQNATTETEKFIIMAIDLCKQNVKGFDKMSESERLDIAYNTLCKMQSVMGLQF